MFRSSRFLPIRVLKSVFVANECDSAKLVVPYPG